jgi:hypothetical protein
MIILAIICLIFFLITLCLVYIIIQLLKKKRLYQNPTKPTLNHLPNNYPKFDHHRNFPSSSPIQMGLTSNQIASLGNMIPTNKELSPSTIVSTSGHDSNKTQSFDNFENELKRTWHEKGITPSNTTNPLSMNDDEIETVNEVLGMEERNGKVYYKVNFTGHPSDYTAWVCEEDLIPE